MPTYVLASVPTPTPGLTPKQQRSEALGNEITELCGYINAGTYRLLEMIREFDQGLLAQTAENLQ